MKHLALHPKTRDQLERLATKQPQALLVRGKAGVGLYTIARTLALAISDKHNVLEITPDDKGAIKIDVIRQLYGHTRAKRDSTLVVLIDNADVMLAPAQNALLKLLEDTPKNTVFLLTAHLPQQLLPTIRSRMEEVDILPITSDQTATFTTNPQLLFLGQGLPAELHRLLHDETYLALRAQQMREAKDFLTKSLYEKLVIIYKLPSDRQAALTLIQDVMHIIAVTLKTRPDPKQASLLKNLLQTEQRLHNDGHVRTQLMNLAVNIV